MYRIFTYYNTSFLISSCDAICEHIKKLKSMPEPILHYIPFSLNQNGYVYVDTSVFIHDILIINLEKIHIIKFDIFQMNYTLYKNAAKYITRFNNVSNILHV